MRVHTLENTHVNLLFNSTYIIFANLEEIKFNKIIANF